MHNMEQEQILNIAREGIMVGLTISLPVLGTALVIGLIISIFQAATQIQESTLTYLPKLVGMATVGLLTASWALSMLIKFTHTCFENMTRVMR